jgi:hypothetical protein
MHFSHIPVLLPCWMSRSLLFWHLSWSSHPAIAPLTAPVAVVVLMGPEQIRVQPWYITYWCCITYWDHAGLMNCCCITLRMYTAVGHMSHRHPYQLYHTLVMYMYMLHYSSLLTMYELTSCCPRSSVRSTNSLVAWGTDRLYLL